MSQPEVESHLFLFKPEGRETVKRISEELLRGGVPLISQIIRIIKDLSNKPESLSVNDLVDFISNDPTTLSRVISISNTLGYNTHGVEVVSVHHAVSVIGFDRVRTLAVSILLLEGAQSKSTAEINRELAGAALISGLVAAEMCRKGSVADPEMAFICSALRGYGRMLAATFLPAEYAAATKISAREGYEKSFEMTFGVSALELGREVLIEMKVPPSIINTFEKASRALHSADAANPASALIALADFGSRAAELLQAADLTNENFEPRLTALGNLYGLPMKMGRPEVQQLLHHVVAVLESFRYQAGVYLGTVMIFRRAKCLAAETPLPTTMQLFKEAPAKPVAPPPEEPPSYDI
jgi:HD-like signal output (HDOD) protein